jgi:hypothetical protein
MDKLANCLDLFDASLEEGDLVGHTAFAELVDPQSKLGDGGKGYRAKEVAVGVLEDRGVSNCLVQRLSDANAAISADRGKIEGRWST